ncbi:protein AMEIOTIC 1 [Zea mays]|uniref:Protein AMEIOTIC 1 n=2 Tax=Zea mays TaxID=4577 RepID=AM1_MAIZE|nr:protein AMEIOTIC 1 [Zea mays]C0RWW9.1 RecName: Full=Protein AMEIOTIC 1 [Zea mays]ABG57250.1 ameiotic 1 [Zea mays]|eukprot:NP_001139538.1 protein AMEIOTIC 1 [Zea mays]
MDVETVQAGPALAAHLQLQASPKPQVKKYYFKKKTSSSHSRNGKDDVNHDSTIQPRSPLSRQSLTFDAIPTYHAGAFYEIDHDKLPPKSPIHLKSIRVVKVSECTNLDITVKFPSLQALRSFFSSYPAPGTGPELDERFVMSSNHAARILRRRVTEEELEGEVQQDSFWLIKPRLYDFAAPQQVPSRTLCLPPPPAPPAATLGLTADSCLLTTLKCDGAGWGMRRRVRYIGRHRDEAPKEASVDGYDTESSVREVQQPPATQEVKRSERNCKRKREAEASSKDNNGDEGKKNNKVQGASKKISKKAKKRTVESKDGDPRHGKDRWSAERYAAAEKSLLNIMRSRDARFGAPVMRQVLREEARKHIGDTGLLDHLLKHMAGRVPEGSVHRFRRRHNADGAMEYWLEPAELAEVRKQAGVSDPYWVPPPGWKPGDDVSLVAGDILVKRQVEELTEEVNGVKRQMEQLLCKDDGDFGAERDYSSLKEKYQRAVRANEKLEKQVLCLKDMCENVVQMNGELKKEVSAFKEKYEHIADKNDKLEEQVTYLSSSFLSFKDQLVVALKLELAPSEAVPRTALFVASGEQMTGTVIQGGQDRAERKSSFRVCKPQGKFLLPSMASGMTIGRGASSTCPAAATPGPGIPRSTSFPSMPGLPRSSRGPVEVVAAASGLDEHVMFGAHFSTPPSASSTNDAAKLQLSLPSPRSPLQPQKLFDTVTAAASGFSPQKLMHFSGLTRRDVDTSSSSSGACGSGLLEGKRVLFDADAGGISAVGTELALATPSYC